MPVLLLARGDLPSRTLLRQAIEARYGHSAPAIETLKIEMKGRSRIKLGFASTWMPVETTVYVKFPSSIRWEYTMRPVGLPVSTTSEAYNGDTLHRTRRLRGAVVETDSLMLRSSQTRLWTVAVMLLTPLSDPDVLVRLLDPDTLEVENTETNNRVQLVLNPDKTLNRITTLCYNPTAEREQVYTLRAVGGQLPVDTLMLPRQIDVLWDDELDVELTPTRVEMNLLLEDSFFKI